MSEAQETARNTPHESKTRPMPEPNLCSECGLSPWADVHLTAKRARTAKAREARRLNVLRRKAPLYIQALHELGYTVTEPDPENPISCQNGDGENWPDAMEQRSGYDLRLTEGYKNFKYSDWGN